MGRLEIKESRRVQLIEATIDTLARHGFAEFTLAQVAEAAGLSQGIVNFYFHSKEALLVETLKYHGGRVRAVLDGRRAPGRPAPRRQARRHDRRGFRSGHGEPQEGDGLVRLLGRGALAAGISQDLPEPVGELFRRDAGLCREIVETGGYADIDPDTVARGLNAMIDGLWLDILTSPKAIDRKEAKRTCFGLLAAVFPREFESHLAAARAA